MFLAWKNIYKWKNVIVKSFYKKLKVFVNLSKWAMCPFIFSYGISETFTVSEQ